ncbi:hypothetical protein JTB14_029007 [Gonioctena quinquepunctata]|nr:hypothetical protein JTB14_029007 [Gonioctena quinquepunctata]
MPKRSIDMGKFQKIKKKMKKLERLLESVSTSSSSDTDHEDFSDRPEPRRRMRISSDEDIEPDEPIVTVAQVHNPPTETGAVTAEGGQTDVNNMLVNSLGVDPTVTRSFGPPLNEGLVTRWSNYLTNGIDKEIRVELSSRWQIPENCQTLSAPKVNPEMDAILSSLDKKKDSVLAGLQDKLGTGLAAIGSVLNKMLSGDISEETRSQITPDLVDAGRIFCEVHFLISKHRKHQFYPTLDKTVQKVAEESKHDNFLFGSDFHEQCKSAQTIQKTSRELSYILVQNEH